MSSAAKSGRGSFPSISGTDRFWLRLVNRKSGSEPDSLQPAQGLYTACVDPRGIRPLVGRVPEDEAMNRPVDLDLRALGPAWSALRKASGNRIGPIRTGAQYERMYRLLQSLVEIGPMRLPLALRSALQA